MHMYCLFVHFDMAGGKIIFILIVALMVSC